MPRGISTIPLAMTMAGVPVVFLDFHCFISYEWKWVRGGCMLLWLLDEMYKVGVAVFCSIS